jgi:AcrR family transcriptional regulator
MQRAGLWWPAMPRRPAGSPSLHLDEIVEAAARVCDRQGYDKLTLSAVASELNIKSPSLYNHVDSLDALRTRLAELAYRQLTQKCALATAGRSGRAAVLAMAHELRRFAKARPGLYAASVSLPDAPDEALLTQMDSMMQLTVSLFAGYRLNAKNVIHAVRGLRSIIHGFIAIETVGAFRLNVDITESYTRSIECFLEGLKNRKTSVR